MPRWLTMADAEETRTPGTADGCEYTRCNEPGAGELRGHLMDRPGKLPWTMCAEHLKPERHPATLRDALVKWPG